jgi:hypothetical protein
MEGKAMAASKAYKTTSCCKKEEMAEATRKIARELYEKSGRKEGRDFENWLEAERIVKSKACK